MKKDRKQTIWVRWPWLLHVLLMLGVSVVVLALVFAFIKVYARHGQEFEMPDLVGSRLADLEADNPIRLDVVVMDSVYRPGDEGGVILTQDPKEGTRVKRGRKCYITTTAFRPEYAVMPELSGLTVRQAVSELISIGLVPGKLKFVDDPYKNNVISQSCKGKAVYAGQGIERGAVVDLTVGLGDGMGRSVVPFAIGRTSERVRRDILSASLNVGREHFDGIKNRRTAVVYRQEPDYTGVSKYPYGTRVELWYIDADQTDVQRMVREFKVDSSKIVYPDEMEEYHDGRPTPDQIDEREDWAW